MKQGFPLDVLAKYLNISFTVYMWFKITQRTFLEYSNRMKFENINKMQIKLYRREYIVHKGI